MKFNQGLRYIFLLLFILNSIQSRSFAQSDSAALAAADTSGFSVNASGGWLLYNSHVSEHGADSILLEIIIRHDNNITWGDEHYVGKIKDGSLLPQNAQAILYHLLYDEYAIRIESDGKCYFRQTAGTTPAQTPVVIPIIVRYKR